MRYFIIISVTLGLLGLGACSSRKAEHPGETVQKAGQEHPGQAAQAGMMQNNQTGQKPAGQEHPGGAAQEHPGTEHPGGAAQEHPGGAAQEHPGQAARSYSAAEIKAAMQAHIDAMVQKGGGVFRIKDEKTGEDLELNFVKIHDPVRKIRGNTYFACTDFSVKGQPDKLYDLDFWLTPQDGKLVVTATKIHKNPVLVDGKWEKKARFTYVNDKPVVVE